MPSGYGLPEECSDLMGYRPHLQEAGMTSGDRVCSRTPEPGASRGRMLDANDGAHAGAAEPSRKDESRCGRF
ncbi:hypothetical protein GCM10027203_14630 [Nonomuraea fastidiosa]|jgi:hypothetical protein